MKVKYSGTQAQKYKQFAEKSFSWKYLEKPVIQSHLKNKVDSSKKILDAGCGTGRSTRLLLDLGAKEENILATDISPAMLRQARRLFSGVKFIESDLVNLDFKENCFDIILSNMVLHYIDQKNLEKVIKKFASWLTSSGYLLFIVVHPLRFPENYSSYFEDGPKTEKTPWNTLIEYYPKKVSDYVNSVIESGLELLSLEEPKPLSESVQADSVEFNKYSSIPSRLVIEAKKK